MHFSGFRAREGAEVGPLIPLVDLNDGPLPDGAPHLADDRLEAQEAMLVFAPQFCLRRRVGLLEASHPHRESFLKASCSVSLAFL